MRKTDRLPSLNALRAFEAVGRTLSFANAAREMNVSPSAISHLVRQLEADLGVTLVDREGKSIRLTRADARMLPELTAGFASLRRSLAMAEVQDGTRILRVNMLPTFAARWLIPRLTSFYERHGGFKVAVETPPTSPIGGYGLYRPTSSPDHSLHRSKARKEGRRPLLRSRNEGLPPRGRMRVAWSALPP